MRIALFSPIKTNSASISAILSKLQMVVDLTDNPDSIIDALSVERFDGVLWDLAPDHADAALHLQGISQAAVLAPVLVAAPDTAIEQVADALDRGAQDFILKPLKEQELRVRLSRLTMRREARQDRLNVEYGPFRVDMARGQILLDGAPLNLTPRERGVLQVLIRHRGEVVSKDRIASNVFSLEDEATPTSIETYMHRLRRKTAHPDIEIKTVRGLGYRLVKSDEA